MFRKPRRRNKNRKVLNLNNLEKSETPTSSSNMIGLSFQEDSNMDNVDSEEAFFQKRKKKRSNLRTKPITMNKKNFVTQSSNRYDQKSLQQLKKEALTNKKRNQKFLQKTKEKQKKNEKQKQKEKEKQKQKEKQNEQQHFQVYRPNNLKNAEETLIPSEIEVENLKIKRSKLKKSVLHSETFIPLQNDNKPNSENDLPDSEVDQSIVREMQEEGELEKEIFEDQLGSRIRFGNPKQFYEKYEKNTQLDYKKSIGDGLVKANTQENGLDLKKEEEEEEEELHFKEDHEQFLEWEDEKIKNSGFISRRIQQGEISKVFNNRKEQEDNFKRKKKEKKMKKKIALSSILGKINKTVELNKNKNEILIGKIEKLNESVNFNDSNEQWEELELKYQLLQQYRRFFIEYADCWSRKLIVIQHCEEQLIKNRELYSNLLNKTIQKTLFGNEHISNFNNNNRFFNSNDNTNFHNRDRNHNVNLNLNTLKKIQTEYEEIKSIANRELVDVYPEYKSIQTLIQKIEEFKAGFAKEYNETYFSMNLIKIFMPIIRFKMISWDFQNYDKNLSDFEWFQELSNFLMNTKKDKNEQEIIPNVIEKLLGRQISHFFTNCWVFNIEKNNLFAVSLWKLLNAYFDLQNSQFLKMILNQIISKLNFEISCFLQIKSDRIQSIDLQNHIFTILKNAFYWVDTLPSNYKDSLILQIVNKIEEKLSPLLQLNINMGIDKKELIKIIHPKVFEKCINLLNVIYD
ncbi:gc-rich sequence DNA-binding factor [Anaeramoeba flamelloides]|uniref:Gc-rich sequence DNA-binding factor n=1 Tax=Anaeramoeba flamelloides TaxID=1746091 RepID=A0ABQ8X366_9EUKA|nr:gc-rich sequence DNA-binding factor [Anaeramoeba flamelloides]